MNFLDLTGVETDASLQWIEARIELIVSIFPIIKIGNDWEQLNSTKFGKEK